MCTVNGFQKKTERPNDRVCTQYTYTKKSVLLTKKMKMMLVNHNLISEFIICLVKPRDKKIMKNPDTKRGARFGIDGWQKSEAISFNKSQKMMGRGYHHAFLSPLSCILVFPGTNQQEVVVAQGASPPSKWNFSFAFA